jgi:hypothetical protein
MVFKADFIMVLAGHIEPARARTEKPERASRNIRQHTPAGVCTRRR